MAGPLAAQLGPRQPAQLVVEEGQQLLERRLAPAVELMAFEAVRDGDTVLLSWRTASETNNAGFEVEYRPATNDRAAWRTLGFVEGHGTTAAPQAYRFTVTGLPPGTYRFRLKQVDYDGSFAYGPEVEAASGTPAQYALEPNYPNPFNPQTTLRYHLPAPTHVRLRVFDALGRVVATLVDTPQPAGHYEVPFDAHHLASGTYFYRLEAGSFVQTRPMSLAR